MVDRKDVVTHPYSDRWKPYVDPRTGEVVTITWAQVAAVLHAVRMVDEVRETQPNRRGGTGTPKLRDDFPEKSRALGRLLVDGKALFVDVPPLDVGAADYELWDEENEREVVA